MAHPKLLCYTVSRYSRNHSSPLPKSRNQAFTGSFIVIGSFFLSYFFFSASISNSPPTLIAATFASHLLSLSSITSTYKHFPINSPSLLSSVQIQSTQRKKTHLNSCNIFDGKWVLDKRSKPHYKPGTCPYVDNAFNCFKNGRTDSNYFQLRWKPHGCNIPRFNGTKMLELLRGKRVVFVGDSLNRNMWQSLVCSMRNSLVDKNRVLDVSGRRRFKTQGFYSFRFKDYMLSIDFVKSPFLVQEWKTADKKGTKRETLRLDLIQESSTNYHNADIIIFNTGHWWTHQKTNKGNNYFQEGNQVYIKLEVEEAYTRALKTWAKWVDSKINSTKTRVFFRGYSASHFRGGQWNSGGSCDGEIEPIWNDSFLGQYPWMMNVLESVMSGMKTPVSYLNISRMTDFRKDGHPSIFRQPEVRRCRRPIFQDCSHWCLPGVPDSWNELLYVSLLMSNI